MNTQTRSTIQSAGRVASAYLAANVGALTGDIPVTGISLPQNEIWRIDRKTTGMVIECLAGMVWITQPGDPNDYILLHGDRFWVTRPGLVLVQAIRDAHFNCSWARGRMGAINAHPKTRATANVTRRETAMHSVANDLTTTGGMVTSDFVCANPACPAERWPVCSQTGVRDLWLVAEAEDARPWRIAASVPICPLCSTDLIRVAAT